MRNVLITGFGPFGGEPINPALEAIKRLEGCIIENHRIVTRELPVTRFESIRAIEQHIRETDPVLVLAIGQAGGRLEITPERVAINIDDFRIPDNGGFQPVDEPVAPGAPVAYWSTLPIKAMVMAMRGAGIPASVSNSAGTFAVRPSFTASACWSGLVSAAVRMFWRSVSSRFAVSFLRKSATVAGVRASFIFNQSGLFHLHKGCQNAGFGRFPPSFQQSLFDGGADC